MAGSTWCRSAVNLSFFPRLAACRTRSNACDTPARSCARRVLCWPAFPLVSVLGSTGSAADCSALFAGFPATTTESDFSGSCIIGYGSSPSRCGPAVSIRRPNPRSPGSRAKSFHTCQGLRPRRAGRVLAIMPPSILPSMILSTSAPGTNLVFAAQWLADALPCRRFADTLTVARARLGADVDRYSFIVVDLHHLLFAGLDRRTRSQETCIIGIGPQKWSPP